MNFQLDVWLRGQNHATTKTVSGPTRDPSAWTDDDVRFVLESMLRAMNRQKHPEGDEPPIALRGLSWIVNPYDGDGVVIAVEITLGAAVAGPFAVEQARLETMITRVLKEASTARVH